MVASTWSRKPRNSFERCRRIHLADDHLLCCPWLARWPGGVHQKPVDALGEEAVPPAPDARFRLSCSSHRICQVWPASRLRMMSVRHTCLLRDCGCVLISARRVRFLSESLFFGLALLDIEALLPFFELSDGHRETVNHSQEKMELFLAGHNTSQQNFGGIWFRHHASTLRGIQCASPAVGRALPHEEIRVQNVATGSVFCLP